MPLLKESGSSKVCSWMSATSSVLRSTGSLLLSGIRLRMVLTEQVVEGGNQIAALRRPGDALVVEYEPNAKLALLSGAQAWSTKGS